MGEIHKYKMKLLLFDIWGTLIETGVKPSPSKQVRYFLRSREEFSQFVQKFEDTFMTKEHESLTAGFQEVVEDMSLRIPDFVYDKLVGMWNKSSILSKEYEDTFDALKKLKKKKYKLVLVANIDRFSWEQLKQKFELDKYFDGVYLSYETGKLKNDFDCVSGILEDFKVKPEEAMLIGDSIESDMKAAENAKIKGLLIDRNDRREYEPKIKSLEEIWDHL